MRAFSWLFVCVGLALACEHERLPPSSPAGGNAGRALVERGGPRACKAAPSEYARIDLEQLPEELHPERFDELDAWLTSRSQICPEGSSYFALSELKSGAPCFPSMQDSKTCTKNSAERSAQRWGEEWEGQCLSSEWRPAGPLRVGRWHLGPGQPIELVDAWKLEEASAYERERHPYELALLFDGRDKHGPWVERFYDGRPIERVGMLRGKHHGLAERWYPNGQIAAREFYVEGDQHGVWRHWYPNGQLKLVAGSKFGREHGKRERWHADGSIAFRGSALEGRWHGPARGWFANGKLASEKEYCHGQLHGFRRKYFESGQLKKETRFRRGKRDGWSREWDASGALTRERRYEWGVRQPVSAE